MSMLINSFSTEKVTLYKLTGEVIESICAVVEPDLFTIEDTSVDIEEDDFFERVLPNGGREYYRVSDRGFYKGDHGIPDHYQAEVYKVSKAELLAEFEGTNTEQYGLKKEEKKPNKLFISHSSHDKDYIQAFVELLEDIGMPDGSIVCTSVPGHGIPGGERIYDWLRKQFVDCSLRVVFALSENYYNSPTSLNEMGAAWVTKTTDTLLLLPGFDFGDIRGCVDSTKIGIKLDGDEEELAHRLTELKDVLLSEYSLPAISNSRWERHRNAFIKTAGEITAHRGIEAEVVEESDSYVPVSTADAKMPRNISVESSLLIVFAATDTNGEIFMTRSLEGTEISTAGKTFMRDTSAREEARWRGALDNLVEWKWVRCVGTKGQVFKVTDLGYSMAEMLEAKMDIDTTNEPLVELKAFIE